MTTAAHGGGKPATTSRTVLRVVIERGLPFAAVAGSVLSVSSRALVDACARLGLDTRLILDAARLDAATLQNPDARIPIAQADALWQKAYELSGDPNLALHAIEVLPFGMYRVIDFLASTAPTVGAALAKVSDYSRARRSHIFWDSRTRARSIGRSDAGPIRRPRPTAAGSSPFEARRRIVAECQSIVAFGQGRQPQRDVSTFNHWPLTAVEVS